MSATYRHQFRQVADSDPDLLTGAALFDATMFEAQRKANILATSSKHDVAHYVYSNVRRCWDYIGTYHADGTQTDAYGELRRFTGDSVRPWEPVSKGGAE